MEAMEAIHFVLQKIQYYDGRSWITRVAHLLPEWQSQMPKNDATLRNLREVKRVMCDVRSHSDLPFSDFQKLVDADELKDELFKKIANAIGLPTTKNIMRNIENGIMQIGEKMMQKNISQFEAELRKRNSQKLERKNGK